MKDGLMIYFSTGTDKYPVTYKMKMLVRASVLATLAYEGYKPECELSVTFTDNDGIQAVNKQYRNIDKATDVLSFPLGEDGVYDINPKTGAKLLGDVVISMEKAQEQAVTFEHSFEREVCYLTVHSVLHLLGYDHMVPEEKAVMRSKEEAVMQLIGLGIQPRINP